MPQINAAGLALVESFEGCELSSYQDQGGVWTIGYGHTGPDVTPGMTITQERARELLQADLAAATDEVARCVEVVLTPNQFSALVSFEFNTGALAGSTLLACVNQRRFASASQAFLQWVYVDGVISPGLIRRRQAERALFDAP